MTAAPTVVARLACDEPTARQLAGLLGEILDAGDTICSAFEGDNGQWQVAIHFQNTPDEAAVRALVKLSAGDAAAAAVTFETVAPTDWVAQSLADLSPVYAGRFVIHGAHDRAHVPVNALGIEIEAALAFGSGHHGTTRACLLALDVLAKRRHMRRVLDLGTGSGVLAMAAVKALRVSVVASDIDKTAIAAARANARLNRVAPAITFVHAPGTDARAIAAGKPYDLIFANILLGPLLRLAVPIKRLCAPGGHVVLSGLLRSQTNAALALYRSQGLILQRRIVLEGWATLELIAPKQSRPGRRPRR